MSFSYHKEQKTFIVAICINKMRTGEKASRRCYTFEGLRVDRVKNTLDIIQSV